MSGRTRKLLSSVANCADTEAMGTLDSDANTSRMKTLKAKRKLKISTRHNPRIHSTRLIQFIHSLHASLWSTAGGLGAQATFSTLSLNIGKYLISGLACLWPGLFLQRHKTAVRLSKSSFRPHIGSLTESISTFPLFLSTHFLCLVSYV